MAIAVETKRLGEDLPADVAAAFLPKSLPPRVPRQERKGGNMRSSRRRQIAFLTLALLWLAWGLPAAAAAPEGKKLFPVCQEGKYGYIDRAGRMVIPPQFAWAGDFAGGLAAVRPEKKGLWGFIDETGALFIPARYDLARDFAEGLAAVEINGKYGFVDRVGAMLILPQFKEVGDFSQGLAAVKIDGRWGYGDRSGKLVIPSQFDEAGAFSEGLADISLNGKTGYIDARGNQMIPPQFFARVQVLRGIGPGDGGKRFRLHRQNWSDGHPSPVSLGRPLRRGSGPGAKEGKIRLY